MKEPKQLGTPKRSDEVLESCQFYLPHGMKQRLRKAASQAGVSMTKYVEEALRKNLADE